MEFEEFNYATKPAHIAYIPLTRHTRFDSLIRLRAYRRVQWLAFQRSTAAAICFFRVLPTFDLTAKKPPHNSVFAAAHMTP